LIKLYALVTNGLCVVIFENREHNVLKLGIAVVQFFSCCWRTGTKLMLIPVSQGRSQTFSFGVATRGASFATRGAVNGLCRTFRKRPEKFWGATGGARQNFGGAVPPPSFAPAVSACANKDGRTLSSQVTCGATSALTIYFIVK